jgi:hypothetical protein
MSLAELVIEGYKIGRGCVEAQNGEYKFSLLKHGAEL